MLNQDFSEAVSETLDILEHTDVNYVNKISNKFMDILKKNASKTYRPNLDHSKKIYEMNLKEQTKSLLTLIYRNYWCTEEQKIELDKILKENEIEYQKELHEKYNPNNIFKNNIQNNNISEESTTNEVHMIKYKESIFAKIKNWFKQVFSK